MIQLSRVGGGSSPVKTEPHQIGLFIVVVELMCCLLVPLSFNVVWSDGCVSARRAASSAETATTHTGPSACSWGRMSSGLQLLCRRLDSRDLHTAPSQKICFWKESESVLQRPRAPPDSAKKQRILCRDSNQVFRSNGHVENLSSAPYTLLLARGYTLEPSREI